jgi:hypothetical protein
MKTLQRKFNATGMHGVLAISSGNPAAGIDPVEMGRCIGMIEGVAL